MRREREVKLAAPSLPAALSVARILSEMGGSIGAARSVAYEDVYLDTADGWLARGGLGLRLRFAGGAATLTLKTAPEVREGVLDRGEIEERVPRSPARYPCAPPGRQVRRWVREITGVSRVEPVARLRVWRTEWPCAFPDGTRLAACADIVAARVGGHTVRFSEVEIEARRRPSALPALARRLADRAGWVEVRESKLERAFALAGMAASGPPRGRPALADDGSPAEAARALLEHYWRLYRWHLPSVCVRSDPEALHDLRVALRRLRAAYAVFRRVLPASSAALFQELRTVARAAGGVRDLDIAIELLTRLGADLRPRFQPAVSAVVADLARRRQARHVRLRRRLVSASHRRMERRAAALFNALRWPREASAAPSTGVFLKTALAAARRKALRALRAIDLRSPNETFHAARVRCKKYRYILEFVVDARGGKARKTHRRLVEVQDALGALQDAVVVQRCLEARAASAPPPSRPAATAAMIRRLGREIRRNRKRAARLARRFVR